MKSFRDNTIAILDLILTWNKTFENSSVSGIENSSVSFLLNILESEKQNIIALAASGSNITIDIDDIKIEGKLKLD